jgi:hypothetical protein
MSIARHVTRSRIVEIGGLLAGRSAPRAIHHRGPAVLRAPDFTNMGFKSRCRAGPGEQTVTNSRRARLQAADYISLAMIKSP